VGCAGAFYDSTVTITLMVLGQVMPGDQKRAADRFAALIKEAGA
jgi:hypothetical protein